MKTNRLQLLSTEVRRHIVSLLLESGTEGVTVEKLLRELARDREDRENLRISLYHCHLPKLEEAGVVEYDRRNGDIVPRKELEALQPLLAAIDEEMTPKPV